MTKPNKKEAQKLWAQRLIGLTSQKMGPTKHVGLIKK